jgi:lipoprotein-releasing system ATP-binding protein
MTAANQNKAAIELRVIDLRKSFVSQSSDRIEVLRGIDLEVSAGEAVAITGASGSGKSTLLHLLGGVVEPDHGSVLLGNTEVEKLSGNAASHFRQFQVGFVFQFHYLMTDLSTIENVALPLLIKRRRRSQAFAEAKALLTELGLGTTLNKPIAQLSGGEQQRAALARALITSPALLLADEPTGNLDDVMGDSIGKTLINHVRRRGSIGVIATHNKKLAALCDRVLLLEAGRLDEL